MSDLDEQMMDQDVHGSDIETEYDSDDSADLDRGVQDTVYGFISFSALVWAIVDTPQFQRLRHIKQLGTSYYVWPGAAHNRFEHCLGVGHLARQMAEHLQRKQPKLRITDRDVRCVTIAGLCHDLGHGPWSHVWDNHFIPVALPGRNWTHEDASEMMFDDLIEKNGIDIDQDDVNFIKDLIKGLPNHSKNKQPHEKSFLFEIVANKRNGIDVDKFDYILRDARAIGQSGNIRAERLILSARVIDHEICYHIKDANQLYELCHTRFSNHKMVYNHKTAKAIQYMIVDAILLAEPYLQLGERITDPDKYVHLTDEIMNEIETSENKELAESRKVFKRISQRDLYKCVDWKSFDWDYYSLLREYFTPEKIVRAAQDSNNYPKGPPDILRSLKTDAVIVDMAQMHYGMKEKNPLDFVKFYGKHNKNKAARAGRGDFSTLMPEKHGEILMRVYTTDVKYYGVIQAGYRRILATLPDQPILEPPTSTPPLTEAPSTPRAMLSAQDSFISDTSRSAPANMRGLASVKASPFQNNSFSEVHNTFIPPSPTLEHRKSKNGGRGGATPSGQRLRGDVGGNPQTAASQVASSSKARKLPQTVLPVSPTPGHSTRRILRKRPNDEDADSSGSGPIKRTRS